MGAGPRARLVAFGTYAGLGLVALALWLPTTPASGLATRWLLSWQDGFPRRALAGTVLRTLSPTVDVGLVHRAAVTVAVLLVLAAAWALARLSVDRPGGPAADRTLLALALLVSAVGWPAVAANLARLDQVLLLCALAAGGCVVRVGPVRDGAAAGLLVVATLVHEAAVPMVAVWIGAWAAHRAVAQGWPVRRAVARGLWVVAPAGVALVGLSLLRPALDPAAALAALAADTDVDLHRRAVEVQYWGLGDNLAMMGRAWGRRAGPFLAGSVAAVVPLVLACGALLRDRGVGWRDLQPTERVLVVASAAPLSLVLVAVDFGRWFAAATILLVVSTLVVLRRVDDRSWPGPWAWAALALVPLGAWLSGPTMARGTQWLVG